MSCWKSVCKENKCGISDNFLFIVLIFFMMSLNIDKKISSLELFWFAHFVHELLDFSDELQCCESCAGCLVVITDHGPRAEIAQALGHELLVDNGEGRLEGLEEERRNREEKEIGEERQPTHIQRTDDHACME